MTPRFSAALLRTQSDERLLVLVGAGQERAFEAIVHRYRKPLERYCARALSRSQAEDVVQQVLLNAWQALHGGAEVRNLKPWLFRIAQTTIIESVQQSGFDYDELARSLSPHEGPDSELEQRAVIRQTLMGLAALPDAQREALLRNVVDGESRAEIAAALGVSEGAVRQLLYRARSSLRTAATALTPLPFVIWFATPAEAAGIAVVAKASAVLVGAGVIAAGPVAVQRLPDGGPEKARAHIEKPAAPRSRLTVARVGKAPMTHSDEGANSSEVTRSREDEKPAGNEARPEAEERDNGSRENEHTAEEARDEPSRPSEPSEDQRRDEAHEREQLGESSSSDSRSDVHEDESGSGAPGGTEDAEEANERVSRRSQHEQ